MRNKSCLIIENENYLSESISSKLEGIGFSSKILFSTKDVMEIEDSISLIILSLNLKDENTFFKAIKKFKNSTIILITSHIDNSCLIKAVDYGADDYILKPFVMDSLIHKINIFQKISDLEYREKRSQKFLEEILKHDVNSDFNLGVKLPLVVFSKIEKHIDSFTFLYSEHSGKGIEVISYKDLLKIDVNLDGDIIYYLREFSKISEKEKIYSLENFKNIDIIFGVNKEYSNLDYSNFNYIQIDSNNNFIENGDILTVADYIKYVIVHNQSKMPDIELAKHLGISRKSLWEKRRKFDVQKVKKS